MVDKPKPPAAPESPILKEMNARISRAETDRNRHQTRIADCYKYALPWRHKFFSNQPSDDFDEVFDETVGTVLEDFSADMLNTFTPQKNNWLSEEPAVTFDASDRRAITDALKRRQNVVFAEMGRSNLYQSLQEAYLDLGPGTMCVLVMDIDPSKPIHCDAIPLTDLLITRGPYGFVDGIFRCKKYLLEDAKVLWPDASWTEITSQQNTKDLEVEIADGCWRVWAEKGDETYQYAVRANGKLVYEKQWKGPGSCPFIVARWSRDSATAWGVGPTYRTLPAIKTLNHVRYLDLKNYDKHVDPPTSYEHDGVMNLDNGVNPGDWIPRAVGSKEPKSLESQAKFDVAVFERDELRSVIRRAHYQDRPEQQGKTPPTATQWADEAAERARRMGTPATNLVQELQIPLYRRFAYLLQERGTLPNVQFEGQDIALNPVSPLLRAQEQEEVVRMDKFAELIVARFGPQMGMVAIDVIPYVKALAEKLGIDPKLIRDEAKIKAAIEQLAPVLKSTGFLPTGTPDVPVQQGLPQ